MMKSHFATIFVITFFFCCIFATSCIIDTPLVPPRSDQVEILLAFKNEFPTLNCDRMWQTQEIIYDNANISSWTKDAKGFDGVHFDDETGVVTRLDLRGACLSGIIRANSSLFRFRHLMYLDLSINYLDLSPFPAGFGRLTNLEFLHLGENGFIGEVPSSISNLTRLDFLNLSYNKLSGRFPNINNLTLLSSIDLSYNHFYGTIPYSLFTMPFLWKLNLRQNHLTEPLENMNSSSKLESLDMAMNILSPRILQPISKFSKLSYLDLSFQNTTNTINFDFLPFKSLEYLDLSGNSVSRLNISSPRLEDLFLFNCKITEFPMFIKTLRNLKRFDISINKLKGEVPIWLWNLPSLDKVNLSYNSLNILEGFPKVLLNSSLSRLDLSSNTFHGSFPNIPPTIEVMAASNNNFTGDIPLTFCNASDLTLLDLSNNNFGGSIPRCLISVSPLALKLHSNNLIGRLPDIESDFELLDVGHNYISGKLPRSLVNSTRLKFLNVESNGIRDSFPFWLKVLPSLEVLVLRSNKFHGSITSLENPLSFPALRIIDISHNNFNGILPPDYFLNWSSPLVKIPQAYRWPSYTGDGHSDSPAPLWSYPSIHLRSKGLNMDMEKIPEALTAIVFSGNRFGGKIPKSIGLLKSLMVLDLSNNSFTGHIPSTLANLTQLDSLDLSRNQLSGKIPQELRVLTFLAYINVSHNKLTGQIPQSTQIGGQPTSSFEGNIDLCGLPLQESCFRGNVPPSTPHTQEPELQKQEQVLNWKATSIGYGLGVLFGLAIVQALASYKPVLFYKLFRL